MRNKLLADFTKSRAYRTTDNALVEGKNGAVVRKHIGYGPIGCAHAAAWQKSSTAYFKPYLNYHQLSSTIIGHADLPPWSPTGGDSTSATTGPTTTAPLTRS